VRKVAVKAANEQEYIASEQERLGSGSGKIAV
jgi:hypothetical protein